jgi:hypothetical protein
MDVSGQLHFQTALPQEKNPRYLLNRRLGGPQIRSGHFGEEKNNLLPVPVIEPQLVCGRARSPAAGCERINDEYNTHYCVPRAAACMGKTNSE